LRVIKVGEVCGTAMLWGWIGIIGKSHEIMNQKLNIDLNKRIGLDYDVF